MNWLNKLPGYRRTPVGYEWKLLRQLPWITLLGTLAPVLVVVGYQYLGHLAAAQLKLMAIFAFGGVVLFWTLMGILMFYCIILILMKGPAYVADAYYRPDANDPD